MRKFYCYLGELFSSLNSQPRLLHKRTYTTTILLQIKYIYRIIIFTFFPCNWQSFYSAGYYLIVFNISSQSGELARTAGQAIPLSAIRDHTISRFHPIAQKQRTDLNIQPGLVSRPVTWWLRQRQPGNLVARSILARPGRRGRLTGQPATPTATTIQPLQPSHHQPPPLPTSQSQQPLPHKY